ncbi:uncharacterized protein DUF4962 [Arcicella aurantiaca]|uniref:Uncharacterized protein DUF4962 n=2 Tax=Arcicella aurantiaca TaxID=591202 RepID=A0A316EFF6_9BACT|nr:uncharacterized protein DUF4962 [Arcicella aurantiaca]
MGQKHQNLFFTKLKIEELKQRIKTDSETANNWNDVYSVATAQLTKNDHTKIDYVALSYLVTGEKKFAEATKKILLDLTTQKTWSNPEMLKRQPAWTSDLKTAEKCWEVAIGLDAIYDELSREERTIIVNGLMKNGVRPALNEWLLPETRIHSLNSMGHNWWTACVYMAGLGCLAVKDDVPEANQWIETLNQASKEWFNFSGDLLQSKPKTWDVAGGMYESVNYASFGVSEYLFFRLAYQNVFPKGKQPDISVMKNIPNFFMHAGYPRQGMMYSLNFGDSHKNIVGERPLKLLWALGIQDPNMLWYLSQIENQQLREGLFKNAPLGILYHPDFGKTPVLPSLHTSAIFKDMGWATMRNSWQKDATLLAVKSGHTWNHAHADANSFILFHKGEPVIKDAGNSSYGTKEYPEYFFQSSAHNVVTFNGKYQPKEQQYHGSPLDGSVSELLDAGEIKYVMANGTGPTSTIYSRNFRHFLWIGKVILVIDDLKAYENGKFEWLLHPEGESKKDRGDISIVNKNGAVLVRPLYPETLVETGYNHDFPEKMVLSEIFAPREDNVKEQEKYYSIGYPEQVRQTKFITAIILKDSVNDKNLPEIERFKGDDMLGVRIKQNGKVTEILLNLQADGRLMHLNSIKTFNGYTTDAYLTALSYAENNPNELTDYFVGYGSFLRKDKQVLYHSLSKLFLIAQKKDKTFEVNISGQPLMNASFGLEKKPSNVMLDKKPIPIDFAEGILKIKLEK